MSKSGKLQSLNFCRATQSLICDHTNAVEEGNCPLYTSDLCLTLHFLDSESSFPARTLGCISCKLLPQNPSPEQAEEMRPFGHSLGTDMDTALLHVGFGNRQLGGSSFSWRTVKYDWKNKFPCIKQQHKGKWAVLKENPSTPKKRKALYKGLQGVSVPYLKDSYICSSVLSPSFFFFFFLMELVLT